MAQLVCLLCSDQIRRFPGPPHDRLLFHEIYRHCTIDRPLRLPLLPMRVESANAANQEANNRKQQETKQASNRKAANEGALKKDNTPDLTAAGQTQLHCKKGRQKPQTDTAGRQGKYIVPRAARRNCDTSGAEISRMHPAPRPCSLGSQTSSNQAKLLLCGPGGPHPREVGAFCGKEVRCAASPFD